MGLRGPDLGLGLDNKKMFSMGVKCLEGVVTNCEGEFGAWRVLLFLLTANHGGMIELHHQHAK